MNSRYNFLESDNSVLEQRLRVVQNDLEDDLNQYFGASGSRGNNPAIAAPPRDYKVVHPQPDGSHALKTKQDLKERMKLLLQIGLARHEAYELAKETNFDINYFREKRYEWLNNGIGEKQVDDRLLFEIKSGNYKLGGYGDQHRRDNKRDQQQSNRRSNDRDEDYCRTLEASAHSKILSFQKEQDYQKNNDRSQSDLDLPPPPPKKIQWNSEMNTMCYGGRDGRKRSHSPELMLYEGRSRSPEMYTRRDSKEKRTHSRSTSSNEHREERNFRFYQASTSARSPSRGFNSMQQQDRESERDVYNIKYLKSSTRSRFSPSGERGFAADVDNFEGFQLSKSSHSSPRSFNSMSQQERVNDQLFDNFPSPGHSKSAQLKTMFNRGEVSKNKPPSANTINYELSTSNTNLSSYGLNFQRNQIGIGNQHTNAPPIMFEDLNNKEPTERNQNSANPLPNIPLFLDDTLIPPIQNLQPFSTAFWKKQPPATKITPEPKRNLTIKEQKKLENKRISKAQTKLSKREKKQERLKKRLGDSYRKPVTDHPIIRIGFLIPPRGLSKAKPQEYWSQWWPRYKYIEKSIPHINPQHKSVIFLLKPEVSSTRKNLLLRLGINKISRNVDLNEKNYAIRDTYKLFRYKKHLENPKFQSELISSEMNRVNSALGHFKRKNVMALLHQSIILRWHISLDVVKRAKAGDMIKSRNAYKYLSDAAFHYLVMESIQQLKEMCKVDWPGFEEFYNSLDVAHEVVDLSTLGFCFNNNAIENNDNGEEGNVVEEEDNYEDGDSDD